MKLYHNALSTCSQKVRMALAEKQLAFDSVLMDLQKGDQFSADYRKINPKAVVPSLEDQGQVFNESTLIIEYLDDAYPQPALKPTAATDRYRMRALMRRIDDTQHPACSVITYAIGLRPAMLNKGSEELEALLKAIPDPVRRANRRAVMQDGIEAAVFKSALSEYMQVLQEAETLLKEAPWVAGAAFSLGDCALLPYVLRFDHLGQKAVIDESLPNIARWYAAVQERPAFQSAVSAWLPPLEGFLAAGRAVAPEVRALI